LFERPRAIRVANPFRRCGSSRRLACDGVGRGGLENSRESIVADLDRSSTGSPVLSGAVLALAVALLQPALRSGQETVLRSAEAMSAAVDALDCDTGEP
jgi:hypothetical protein